MKIVNNSTLSKEEKECIKKVSIQMEFLDKLLGKPILGTWCPTGPIRYPDTADDPELANKLLKRVNKTK